MAICFLLTYQKQKLFPGGPCQFHTLLTFAALLSLCCCIYQLGFFKTNMFAAVPAMECTPSFKKTIEVKRRGKCSGKTHLLPKAFKYNDSPSVSIETNMDSHKDAGKWWNCLYEYAGNIYAWTKHLIKSFSTAVTPLWASRGQEVIRANSKQRAQSQRHRNVHVLTPPKVRKTFPSVDIKKVPDWLDRDIWMTSQVPRWSACCGAPKAASISSPRLQPEIKGSLSWIFTSHQPKSSYSWADLQL